MNSAGDWLGPLPSSNWQQGPRAIDGSVLHSMVGTIASATSRFRNPSSIVSATFGVGLSGRLVTWVRPIAIAFHAGNWPINVSRLGFEFEDDGAHWDSVRTPEMYLAGGTLLGVCSREYKFPLTDERNGPHRRYSATACPSGLDVARILAIAQGEVMYVSKEEFDQYAANVSNAFTAVKALLNPLAAWAAGAPGLSTPKVRAIAKHLRVIEIATKMPKIPKRNVRRRLTRPRGAPSDARVLAGHGKGGR